MISIKDKCRVCTHRDTCKYSKDYIEFGDKILNLSNKLDSETIAEGVAQIELTCKYYKPITSTPQICEPPVKINLNDIVDKDEDASPCKTMGCSDKTIASCCGCPEFFDWKRRKNNGKSI